MIPIRKLMGLVLLVALSLTVGRVGAQWTLPADYDRGNDKQNPLDMRGGKGLGMNLLYYESFESKDNLVTQGWGKTSNGWSQEVVSSNASNAITYWTLSNGGGQPRTGAFSQPGRAYDGQQNALCHGKTTRARQRLVTPKMNLSGVANGDPRLVFYYASPETYNGFCRLELQYREGPNGEWKRLPGARELYRTDGWVQVSVPLPAVVRKDNMYLGFVSSQNNGYGTAIDEVYIVNIVGAQAKVKQFDFYPQSSKLACGAKKVPLMRIDVAVGPGGGKLKLVNLAHGAKSVKIHTFNPKTKADLLNQAIEKFYLYVGQGSSFSAAKLAGELATTGGANAPYTVTALNIDKVKNGDKALIMQGGNSYSVWIAADLKDKDDLPYKTKIWLEADAESCEFIWLDAAKPDETATSDVKSYFPTSGHDYKTPDVQRSVVYKRLAYDDFENGAGKWEMPTGTAQQLWAIGNPGYVKAVYEKKTKEKRIEQVEEAYSGNKVLATGEILEGEVLYSRYFQGMTIDEAGKPGLWIQKKDLIDATNVNDVYLMLQKSFNTPYGMVFVVEGRYEGDQQWVEFARYELASSDWTNWQPMALRMSRADGRKFHLRLRGFYPGNDVSRTGFIIDDFEVLGDEVQDDIGITSLSVTDSWDNGKGRKVKFTVKNLGKNPQTGVKYDVYIDGTCVLPNASINATLAAGSEQEVTTDATFDAQLTADTLRDNTHHVEVRLKLDKDEDARNNTKSMRVYSYPTIKVTDDKFYPEKFGDPMQHWFGQPYKEGYSTSWLFNTVYSISKCREGSKLKGRFGENLLLGNYIWTTGDHSAVGFEQSALESPVFEISTTTKAKEFVMAYVTEGKQVQFRVEYRTEGGGDWKKLEKSTVWEKNWYGNGGTSTAEGWQGEVEKYTIVKTQLPEDLQGKNGKAVKVQFRVYFYNKEAGRVGGLAINGVEIRPMRADLSLTGHTPEGGCGNPLGNDKTLRIKVKNSDKPAVTQEAMQLPVSIEVTRDGKTTRQVKQLNLGELKPGEEKEYDTEVLLPWGAESGKDSEIKVTLLPQSSEKGVADEDVSNNQYERKIEAKVPASFPLKELVVEKGKYMLYTSVGSALTLLSEPSDAQYKGYKFTDFSVSGNASLDGASLFKVNNLGDATLKYKVGGCDMTLNISIAQFACDVTVGKITAKDKQNCKDEKDDLSFTVEVKDNVTPSKVANLKLVVTQDGRELYSQSAKVGTNSVTISGSDPAKRVRSGGGKLKFTAIADADKDGSNNTVEYGEDILLYPSPLTVYLQDANEEAYMRIAKNDPKVGENTYGSRDWQFYVPKTFGIDKVVWKDARDFEYPGEDQGHRLRLGTLNGVMKAIVALTKDGKEVCPAKEVFSVKLNNQDIEVQGLGGVTGLPTLCEDAKGNFNLYVGVVNNSWRTYSRETWFAFELSNSNKKAQVVQVQLGEDLNPRVLRQIPLGELPKALAPANGQKQLPLTVKYLGYYTDSEKTMLELDAYTGNNERTTELKLSKAPEIAWKNINLENGEYVLRHVFPTGATVPTFKLAVDDKNTSGMSYSWYSQSGEATLWAPETNTSGIASEFQIYGVGEDRYKVEATNLEGCRTELTMRFIQTDVSFDGVEPVVSPSATCKLSDNDGQLIIRLKNTGSKNLTSKEKFKITGDFNDEDKTSAEIPFNGVYAPGERIEVVVDGIDLTKELEGKSDLTINDLKLEVVGNWAVTGAGKEVSSLSLTEKGRPDPLVYLLKIASKDFKEYKEELALEPKSGMKSGESNLVDKTYSRDLTGFVKKKKEESAMWYWRYDSRFDFMKIDNVRDKDCAAEIAQQSQKDWMKAHIAEVGSAPNTLDQPKYPDGDYKVTVTDKNLCQASVNFSIKDKSYDIELEDMLVPQSSCDMPKEGTTAKIIIHNVGTMTISKDAKIKLTLNREDSSEPGATTEEGKAYQQFIAGAGKKQIEKEIKVGDYTEGKDLAKRERIQVEVPLVLYCECESGGVKRSALDGMKFKFDAKIEFVDPVLFNETNVDNNKTKRNYEIEDFKTPKVTQFSVQTKKSPAEFLNFKGDGGHYVWRENAGSEPLPVVVTVEPSDLNVTWRLRNNLKTYDNKSVVGPGTEKEIKVKGTGRIDVEVVSTGGCHGNGSFSIMGENPDLVVKAIVDGLPSELCPESVAGKRKVKIQIENLSPSPLNTSDPAKPCGQGERSEANVTLTLTDGNGSKKLVEKTFKPEELFGASQALYTYDWHVDPSTNEGSWQQSATSVMGVGLSGFGKTEVTLDGVELDPATWKEGAAGAITVELKGGCEETARANNNSYAHNIKVRKSPDVSKLLVGERKYYVRTGETARWSETWETTQQLKHEMEWGKKGAETSVVNAQFAAPSKYTLPLSAKESGAYELKVKDDLGCVATKEVAVHLPGFLSLAESAVIVTPESLLKGACDYKDGEQGLKVTLTNVGNEALILSDKRTSVELSWEKTGGTKGKTRLDHSFAKNTDNLEVGLSTVLDLSNQFRANVHFTEDGTYKLSVKLVQGVTDPVDEADEKVRGEAQEVVLKRFYQPKGKIDLKDQLAKVYGKSVGELNFRQLAKMPETFKLYGLVQSPAAGVAPSGDEFTKLQNYGAEWTWYVDGEAVEGPSPSAFEKSFSVPDPYGKVQVKLKTNQGCTLESEEVEVYRLREYQFSSIALKPMTSRGCADKNSSVGTDQNVGGSFSLAKADGVLKKDTELSLVCKYWVTEGGKAQEKEVTRTIALDKDYKEGDVISFEIQVPFKVGDNSVTMADGKYTDPISGRDWTIKGCEGAPLTFFIKAGPAFATPVVSPQKAYAKPYLILLPDVQLGQEGDKLEYKWNVASELGKELKVKDPGKYNVVITESNGCVLSAEVAVNFYHKYTLTIESEKGSLQVFDDATGAAYAPGEQVIEENSSVKLQAQANAGYKLEGILVDDEIFDVASKYQVKGDFSIRVMFKADKDPSPDPEPTPDAVESELLQGVVVVNPFESVLRLHGASNVDGYAVYNQLGVEVLRGDNAVPTGDVLEIATGQLPDGVYVLRLRDATGGERVLRVVKARGI